MDDRENGPRQAGVGNDTGAQRKASGNGMTPVYARDLPVIETDRLRLRPITRDEDDVAALFAMFREPDVARYWSAPVMRDATEARQLIKEIIEEFEDGELHEWALELRDAPGLIGTCALAHLDFGNRRGEIGFALQRSTWGHGYMSEMLPALIDHAFGALGLHRLEADVDPRNAASLRTLEKLGFRVEGHLRERWQVGGEVQDSVFLGLLAPEWRARGASGAD